MQTITRAFIYARKSTDTEDRQVYSIDHQLKELRDLACRQGIDIVAEFTENRTAKTPGRPIFNQVLSRLKKGEASILLAWHPDRLARNGVDGGMIMHLLDTGVLTDLKFSSHWFEPTPQGMLMLSIAFGMSKYYTDSLSQGITRAYRRRIDDGYWPRRPPPGYLFDRNTRTVVLDLARASLVRETFQLYAAGDHTLKHLARAMNDRGLRSCSTRKHQGLPLACSQYHYLLQNPFYAGMIRYRGELFEGRHEPIVSADLFDRCQIMLAQRGRRNPEILKPFLYRKLFRCAECGCMITNETKKGITYLRCTKRRGPCSQRYLREDAAAKQIVKIIRKFAVTQHDIDTWIEEIRRDQKQQVDSVEGEINTTRVQIAKLDDKQRRLTEVYVEGTLPASEFRASKEKLIRNRRTASEKLSFLEHNRDNRFEPAVRFLRGLAEAQKIVDGGNPAKQSDFFKKVGSNFFLKEGRLAIEARGAWKHVVGQRFSGVRQIAAPAPRIITDATFSTRCRDLGAVRSIMNFFRDNPTWK